MGKRDSADEDVGQAKTELPAPRERWTEEQLPTLPADKRYEIIDEVGRGGMGKVVRAYDRRLDRPIAIKSLLGSREHVSRFLHEARITARLEHPGIVPVHDAGRLASGEPFYAMKLVGGRTLEEAINSAGSLPARLALLGVIIDVAYAIAYAHSQGVIHRDLKPANVLVGDFGETLVIDWGLSKEFGRDAKRSLGGLKRISEPMETVDGSVMGTPAYMPPEQARGDSLDYRTDVWAIGALLYSLLTLHVPHQGSTKVEMLAAARTKQPRPIRELEPTAPPDLVAIAERAMAFDMEHRYASALELAEDLKRFQTGRLVAARNYGLRDVAWHWVRRNATVVVIGALLALVLVAIGAISVKRIVAARKTAVAERQRAQERERDAQQQAAQVMLTEARAQLAQDATAALVGLKRLVGSPGVGAVSVEDIRAIAADAVSRGVIRHVMRGHTAEVLQVECSPDGRIAYSRANDGALRVWDLTTGTARGKAEQVAGRVHAFALAGETIATAEDDGVVLRDRDMRVVRRIPSDIPMRTVVLTTEYVYAGGEDGRVRAWPLTSGGETSVAVGGEISAIASASDGRIVAGTSTGSVAIWRHDAAAAVTTASVQDKVHRLAFDHHGRIIIISEHGYFDWEPPRAPRRLASADHSNGFDIAITADDRWLGLANGRDTLLVDRVSADAKPIRYEGVDGIAFSPSGRIAALTQREGLILRNLVTGVDRQLALFRNAIPVRFAGENSIVVGGVDGDVFVLELGGLVADDAWMTGSKARAIELSRDHARLLTFTFDRVVYEIDIATRAMTSRTVPSKIQAFEVATEPHQVLMTIDGAVMRLDVVTDRREQVTGKVGAYYCIAAIGTQLVYSDLERRLHVRELTTGSEAVFMQPDLVISCDVSDGVVVVGTNAGKVRRIDMKSGAVLGEDANHRGPVTAIAVDVDGTVISGSTEGTVRAWRDKSILVTRHPMPVWGVAVANGLVASTSSDRTVRVSSRDGTIVRMFRGHNDDVSGVIFAPDAGWLASSSLDGTVRRFVVGGDSPPKTLGELARWLDAHTSVEPAD